jgi:GTPase SAR1 family protein
LRNAVGVALVYDITSRESFEGLKPWVEMVHDSIPDAFVLLVGNKSDLEDQRKVGDDLVEQFANRHHLETIDVSALSGTNVNDAFRRIALGVLDREEPKKQTQPVILTGAGMSGRTGCCS